MKPPKPAKARRVEFSLETLQNNPVTRQQLAGFIEEIASYRREIVKSNEGIKDCRTESKESLGIPGRVLMKLVRESMDPGVLEAEAHELEEVQLMAQAIEHGGKVAPT